MSTESQHSQSSKGRVLVGDRAPAFSLQTQTGANVSLRDFLGMSDSTILEIYHLVKVVLFTEAMSFLV
jgi:hypothetical protein